MNKGIPFWEQHIEKMVLGLAAVVMLAVLAAIATDYDAVTAEIDNRTLAPAEVDEVMVGKARELNRQLEPDAEAETEQFLAVDGSGGKAFRDRLAGSTGPSTMPPLIAPSLASVLLPEEVGTSDVWYYEPVIPEPRIQPMVMQTIDTLEATELERNPDLADLVGSSSGDLIWTTPVASIDLAGFRKELEGQDSMMNPMRSQIPSNWYNRRPYVIDVVFERQAKGDDGEWGTTQIVEPVPGRLSYREEIVERIADGTLDAGFRQQIWLQLDDKVNQVEVLQPEFYATRNDSFAAPALFDDRELSADDGMDDVSDEEAARRQEQREIERRLRDRVSSAGRIEATLKELGGELREGDAGSDDGDSGSGRGGGRGGGKGKSDPGFGSSGQGKKGSSGTGSATDRRRRMNLTMKLDRLRSEIERLQDSLEAMDPDAADFMGSVETAAVEVIDIAVDDEMLVWTHDLSVEPGATYRYRCTVRLYNPLFARSRQLLEAQQERAKSFTIESLTSDWSSPIEIRPPVEFYVVRASEESGSLGLGEVRVEMYRYFNGSRRSTQFSVQPGERIGRTITVPGGDRPVAVDFSTDWYLVAVVADPAASGGSGLDRDDDATVVCRRIDGTELRLRVPSRELVNQDRIRFKTDAGQDQSS
jgi:hypothetical protein